MKADDSQIMKSIRVNFLKAPDFKKFKEIRIEKKKFVYIGTTGIIFSGGVALYNSYATATM